MQALCIHTSPLANPVKEKGRGKLSKGVRLIHGDVPVHTALIAKAVVKDCGFREISHLACMFRGMELVPTRFLKWVELRGEDIAQRELVD